MKYRFKLIFVLFFVSLLTSCTVKVSYRFLDNLIGWQIGKYVELKGDQKKEAKQGIDAFHDWHRHTQLQPYANYLNALKLALLAGPVTPEYLHQESNKIQDFLDISMQQFLPVATQIAASLSADQIEEVLENMERDIDEYREDYIDAKPSAIQKQRIRDITRYIGGFFGKFTDEQKARLRDWEENLVAHEELMIEQQKIWQTDFLAAMEHQNDREELQSRLLALMLYRTDNWKPELQSRLDTNQQLTFIMLADLFNSQTEKQKKKMESKFDQYINDLEDLAEGAKSNK